MAEIELVIKIPEHDKNVIKRFVQGIGCEDFPPSIIEDLIRAVYFATPLPKGHDRLIEAKVYENNIRKHYFDNRTVIRCTEIALENTPTVIEADKESEE